jgi:hypothetical protein
MIEVLTPFVMVVYLRFLEVVCAISIALSALCFVKGWNVRHLVEWRDFWIGMYWDRKHRRLYVFPIPCLGLVIQFPWPEMMEYQATLDSRCPPRHVNTHCTPLPEDKTT